MNKKIIFLFLFICCILSTIAISVWGKVPESDGTIKVSQVEILDPTKEDQKCEINDEGNKIIIIKAKEGETLQYQLLAIVHPEDATDQKLIYTIRGSGATIDENGLITFTTLNSIRVLVRSNNGQNDEVIIEIDKDISDDVPI